MSSRITTLSPPRSTVVRLIPGLAIAALTLVAGCSFDSSVGVGADQSEDACSASSPGACPDARPSGDGDSPDTQTPDADATTGLETDCPSGDCPCNYRGSDTGVCSNGTVEGNGCAAPETWVEEEGTDGGCGDGLDNDCDGETDENCECEPNTTESCYTGPSGTAGTGPCKPGMRTCNSDGTWSDCQGETTPSTEQCGSGADEDCSGTSDDGEGCSCSFKSGDGVCSNATYDSDGNCTAPGDYEQTESSCDDGLDNDCDGDTDAVDSDCPDLPAGSACNNSRACQSGVCTPNTMVCTHRIFVTSQTFAPDFGGVGGADQECQSLANSAGLTGTWKALVSVENNAVRDRLQVNAPVLNIQRQLVATGAQDLWTAPIQNAVRYDETATVQNDFVWSGSDDDGTWDGSESSDLGDDCDGWTSTSGAVTSEVGNSVSAEYWLQSAGSRGDGSNNRGCNNQAALYCIDGQ